MNCSYTYRAQTEITHENRQHVLVLLAMNERKYLFFRSPKRKVLSLLSERLSMNEKNVTTCSLRMMMWKPSNDKMLQWKR
jgi:hypothetical protein